MLERGDTYADFWLKFDFWGRLFVPRVFRKIPNELINRLKFPFWQGRLSETKAPFAENIFFLNTFCCKKGYEFVGLG